MISANNIVICGRRKYHQVFDAKGKPYTTMWLRLQIPYIGNTNTEVLCEIPINEKQMDSPSLNAITSKLDSMQNNAFVVAMGQIVNKNTKDGPKKSALRVGLSSIEVVSEDVSPFNEAFVAGDVESRLGTDNISALLVGFSYHDPLNKEWKKRKIPVTIPQPGEFGFDLLHRNALEKLRTAKRVAISGLVRPKDNAGNDMVNIYATRIIPIG